MIEQWFTQTEWQGIKFGDLGVRLEPRAPASSGFYTAFYQALTKKYKTYEDLPAEWKQNKSETARELARLMPKDALVLSYGAGIGFIEQVLIREYEFTNLSLWDWAPNSTSYAPKGLLNYVETLEVTAGQGDQGEYDFIYLAQVLYGMSTPEAIAFLGGIRPLINAGGGLVLVNTSPNNSENQGPSAREGVWRRFRASKTARPLRVVKRWIRSGLTLGGPSAPEQGWGWARDNEAVSRILLQAGYLDVSFHSAADQSFVVATVQ